VRTLPHWRRSAAPLLALAAACAPGRQPGSGAPPRTSSASAAAVLTVGHRGASGHAPEHTVAAYDLALGMGADYIEQDLQLTSDGVLVALHDLTLDRTARGPAENCTGLVIEKTLAQLRTCDVGSWFNEAFPGRARPEYAGLRIPTLDELFRRYGHRARYYVETKNPEEAPGMEEALLRLMDRYELRAPAAHRRQVLIQSFSAASLQKIHALDPSLPLVQLFGGPAGTSALVRAELDAVRRYAVGIGPPRGAVDAALVAAAHARCLDVHPYTVNESREMASLVALGVDGMFTNFPDRLAAVLGRTGSPDAPGRAGGAGGACRRSGR
jgi:glycerophosphoryl diester phosphodiesterase